MPADGVLDALNEWLAGKRAEERVEFSEPVDEEQIAEAEADLGVSLPPSYVDFVTRRGTFFLSGDLTGFGRGNDTELLGPEELVSQTLRYREELADSGDGESQEILDDGILFCADPGGEFFHLFVVSSAGADGEMATRSYDYQDPANNDPWNEGDGTFESVLKAIAERVKENLG